MKTLCLLIAVVASLFASRPTFAADEAAVDPGAVAEKFYAGYVAQVEANKDTKKWVAGSKLVTANFKKTYAKAMSAKEVDADPVLNAQDVPSKPFKAGKPEIKDTAATVVLVTSFGKEKHQVTATLKKVDGVWLLDSVK
jgi:lipoprotein-anchoring transpeptidase ErfK/SrfK